MTNRKKLLVGVAIFTVVSTASASSASACSSGFLADLACRTGIINQSTANRWDREHARLGRPLDHAANQAAGAVANYFVPGSGPYVTQGLEYRDMYNRGQWQPPQAMYAPMPRYGQPFYGQPAYAPMPQPPYAQPFYGQPMYAPVLRPMYAPAMPPYIVR